VRALGLLLGLVLAFGSLVARAGNVEGSIRIGIEGTTLQDVRPLIVHLEPVSAPAAPRPTEIPVMRQSQAQFSPSLLVVSEGQKVEMRNDDSIYHNVFSYSLPNDFDLGVYPQGESRTVGLDHPGLVRIFCSIHESMSATVLVAASPFYAQVPANGRFRIPDVPAGKYRLHLWSPVLPAQSSSVEIPAAGSVTTTLSVGETTREVGQAIEAP